MIHFLFSILTLAMAGSILVIAGSSMVSAQRPTIISPLPDSTGQVTIPTANPTPPIPTVKDSPKQTVQSPSLASVITESLSGTKGTYAIVVKHLVTGETYSYNADRQFATASLYKLWVMASAFSKIEDGSLSADEKLSSSVAALNSLFNISPEYAELTEGFVSMTVSEALHQMITISHNYAALLITKRITVSAVRDFLKSHGLHESAPGEPPTSTARDIALFFELLMTDKLAGHATTEDMIGLLKKQQLNEKLPKYLPDSVEIAHKTGELDYYSHDAGIVFGKRGPYIIVILSETANPQGANDRIAAVSKAVYGYFER